MKAVSLHEKEQIYQRLKKEVYLHLYSIGDLDDFFWPRTIWFGLLDGKQLRQVALLYLGHDMPILLALSKDIQEMRTLLNKIKDTLPAHVYAHLSPTLIEVFQDSHQIVDHGRHLKMGLLQPSRIPDQPVPGVKKIRPGDLDRVLKFYRESYPGHWFDPQMLETGQYFGVETQGRLISLGGVHVYSPRYQVAALGNIATHPQHRNQGYASRVTARLCQSLLQEVDYVGLNVKESNQTAIAIYQNLGFTRVAPYHEYTIRRGHHEEK